MVIDDSITVCKIFEVCLHRAGYEVKCCPDGVLAIQWLKARGAPIPDLIFVDLGLPNLDGYGVIRCLRSHPVLSQTPFVIISRRDGLMDKLKGKLVGATDYLTKPIETTELLSLVQGYLGAVVPV